MVFRKEPAGNGGQATRQQLERRVGSGGTPHGKFEAGHTRTVAYLLIIALFIPDRFANLNNVPTFKKVGI